MSVLPSTEKFDGKGDGQGRLGGAIFEQAALEYIEARQAGNCPETEEFVARFPTVEDELREFIAAIDVLPSGAEDKPLPREFGDFKDVEQLARGGMGVVYTAYHIPADLLVAIKTLRDRNRASASDVQRFLREFKQAAKLRHDHIVRSYFVGWHEGAPFFVMHLMDGGTLAKRLDEFRLPKCGKRSGKDEKGQAWSSGKLRKRQTSIAALLETIARAVHYAHQRGILHRDIKPGNILFDSNGRPHVSDFGLAKRLKSVSAHAETPSANDPASRVVVENDLTGSGGIVGTAA